MFCNSTFSHGLICLLFYIIIELYLTWLTLFPLFVKLPMVVLVIIGFEVRVELKKDTFGGGLAGDFALCLIYSNSYFSWGV
jgi:hypothetical protein